MKKKIERLRFRFIIVVIGVVLLAKMQVSQAYILHEGLSNNDIVLLNYRGYFPNDTVFDAGGDYEFVVKTGSSGVIQGFYDILIGMEVGDSKTGAEVPPELGYTDPSHPYYGETLLFDVKILELRYDAYLDDGDQVTEILPTDENTENETDTLSDSPLALNLTTVVISLGLIMLVRKKI